MNVREYCQRGLEILLENPKIVQCTKKIKLEWHLYLATYNHTITHRKGMSIRYLVKIERGNRRKFGRFSKWIGKLYWIRSRQNSSTY